MFLSLNKKIIISIVAFFVLSFSIFGYTLYSLYNSKLQEDQQFLHLRNTQYNELLYRYNSLKAEQTPNTAGDSLTKQKLVEQEAQRYNMLEQNLTLILLSLSLFSLMIMLLILFLHRLILRPVRHFSKINKIVQQGTYSQRLHLPHRLFYDEFNTLEHTYNSMLSNIEEQIARINNQKEFLQNIIDGLPDALRVIDFSGGIIMTNRTYRQKFGDTNIGVKCYASLLGRHTPCPPSMVDCPLKNLQTKNNIRFIQQLQGGQKQYLSVNAARIDATDQPLIIESFRDLSDDIKFSHQEKISSLGFLTASIAHEIKNNLGSMRLIFESLLQGNLPSTSQQKYLELIYDQLLECIKIPERLLKLAQFSPDNNQPINCMENINEICALLDYEATRNGIAVSLAQKGELRPVLGSETDFKMIILNLAQNAVKAMPNGGKLDFSVIGHPRFLEILIADSGEGIAKPQLPHIFEPFYSNDHIRGHTGLGLAIVKSLLHNFGGDIKVSSQIGKGTTFRLKFPYKNKK